MANTLLELEAATEKISLLEKDIAEALLMASNGEASLTESKATVELLKETLSSANLKIASLEESQKDFDAKVEAKASARALEITASVGVPPVVMTPTPIVTPDEVEKQRISSLKGLARSEAALKLQFKNKSK